MSTVGHIREVCGSYVPRYVQYVTYIALAFYRVNTASEQGVDCDKAACPIFSLSLSFFISDFKGWEGGAISGLPGGAEGPRQLGGPGELRTVRGDQMGLMKLPSGY